MVSRLRSSLVVSTLLATLVAGCIAEEGGPSPSPSPSPSTSPSASGVPREWSADASNEARARMASAYSADVPGYWASHGLPALARTADMREHDGVADPNAVFALVMRSFDAQRLLEACELRKVHPLICDLSQSPDGLPGAIRVWVARGDAERFSREGPGRISEETTRGLRELVETSFDRDGLVALGPAPSKIAEELPPIEEVVCVPPPGGSGSSDAGSGLTWAAVSSSTELAGGQPDGMCMTKATGLCTQRLGLRDATVTPEAWQELSRQLNASPTGGAKMSAMRKYFEDNGYAFSDAWNGPSESACEEAMRALSRGCDVFLWYDAGDTKHIEVVEGMSMSTDTPRDCVATTNSWGQSATTKVSWSTYSEKSDLDRYGGADRFRPTGRAAFHYACRKQQ